MISIIKKLYMITMAGIVRKLLLVKIFLAVAEGVLLQTDIFLGHLNSEDGTSCRCSTASVSTFFSGIPSSAERSIKSSDSFSGNGKHTTNICTKKSKLIQNPFCTAIFESFLSWFA